MADSSGCTGVSANAVMVPPLRRPLSAIIEATAIVASSAGASPAAQESTPRARVSSKASGDHPPPVEGVVLVAGGMATYPAPAGWTNTRYAAEDAGDSDERG